jgi:hypothetical protein
MAPDDFCILILSHGRPNHVVTLKALQAAGSTAPWYLVLDDEDPTIEHYRLLYGANRVVTFAKDVIAAEMDAGDLSPDRGTVVYARNASFGIARNLGYRWFLQLDDDYSAFHHRFEEDGRLGYVPVRDFDAVCRVMLDWLEESGAATVALGQGGDLMGGKDSRRWQQKVLRKAMNSFYCRSADDWRFVGRVNEDVNTYTLLSHQGYLFLTTLYTTLVQVATQSQSGGMTAEYLRTGTYAKSFYSVMYCPSAVRVSPLHAANERMHHLVDWTYCAPKIVPASLRRDLDAVPE